MSFHFTEAYEHRSSPIHRLDPRAKVVSVLFLILAVNLAPEGAWLAYSALLVFIWTVIRISRVGLSKVLKRSLIALPFILAALTVTITVKGNPIVTLPWFEWQITDSGLVRFGTILLRFWIAVQAAILVTMVTRFPEIVWSLRAIKVPVVLVSVIAFLYRYLFVIGNEALRMHRARTARSASATGRHRPGILWQARVSGSMVGSLFLRALDRSERIHSAMLSRGYDGSPRLFSTFDMKAIDWALILSMGTLVILVFMWRLT